MPRSPNAAFFHHRYSLFIFIVFSFYTGGFLVLLPWISWIWENNYFLYRFPEIRTVVLNPFFRGAISGLGLLNVLIGVEEIIRHRQRKAALEPKPTLSIKE